MRRLAADDWQQLRVARLAALAEAPYAFASTLAREQAFDAEVWRSRAGSGRTFGAFDAGTIVGLATGFAVGTEPAGTEPAGTEPAGTEPAGTEPAGTEPAGTEPAGTEPAGTEPAVGRGAALGDWTPAWHLVGMWVSPGLRGQGVADGLVEAVCEQARQAGAGTITLWVTEVNGRATGFYRRFGFVPTGARQLVRPEEPDHWEEELALRLT